MVLVVGKVEQQIVDTVGRRKVWIRQTKKHLYANPFMQYSESCGQENGPW
jgi:hypothetical protein